MVFEKRGAYIKSAFGERNIRMMYLERCKAQRKMLNDADDVAILFNGTIDCTRVVYKSAPQCFKPQFVLDVCG